jgi:hypothetical protein
LSAEAVFASRIMLAVTTPNIAKGARIMPSPNRLPYRPYATGLGSGPATEQGRQPATGQSVLAIYAI